MDGNRPEVVICDQGLHLPDPTATVGPDGIRVLKNKYVNGVDIIRCDDAGQIVEFRVMIRPLQAVNIVHEQMRAMLESLSS